MAVKQLPADKTILPAVQRPLDPKMTTSVVGTFKDPNGTATAPLPPKATVSPTGLGSADVNQRLAETLDQNSPVMQRARYEGVATAGRRGLQNSTLAAEAGQAAVIDKALPIAQQNAAQAAQGVLSNQAYEQSRVLQGDQYAYNSNLSGQDYQQQLGLGQQNFGFNTSLADQQYTNQRRLAHQQNVADRRRQQDSLNTQLSVAQLEANTRLQINSDTLTAQERAQTGQLAIAADENYTSTLNAISSNPDIPANVRRRLLDNALNTRNNSVKMIEKLYGTQLRWSGGNNNAAQPSTPGTPSAPTTPVTTLPSLPSAPVATTNTGLGLGGGRAMNSFGAVNLR